MIRKLLFLIGSGFGTVLVAHGVMAYHWFWGTEIMWSMIFLGTIATLIGVGAVLGFSYPPYRMIRRNGDNIWPKLCAGAFMASALLVYLGIVGVVANHAIIVGSAFLVINGYYFVYDTRAYELEDDDFRLPNWIRSIF